MTVPHPPPGRSGVVPGIHRGVLALALPTAVVAMVGSLQLLTGRFTPPVSDLEALGLHSWALPGLWLAATVAVPCTVAAVLALRRSPATGSAAVVAAGLLALELVVQIPFVGPDPLQAVMGLVALGLGVTGILARRRAVEEDHAG
jgi:hypothetical protein